MTDSNATNYLSANWALLPDGWHQNVGIRYDANGLIQEVESASDQARLAVLIPGMINTHSHAFQRALAGRTHRFTKPRDDFWSWRSRMYSDAELLTPEAQLRLGSRVFSEFLSNGYTTVCEFHYTHGAVNSDSTEIPALMCEALIQASNETGIRMRLLPVLYQLAGFGNQQPKSEQRSFVLDTSVYLGLLDYLRTESTLTDLQSIGYAPHSLRAVGYDSLKELLDHRRANAPESPVHIHISEQIREVNESMLSRGKRPVEWLLDSFHVDSSWCLIHATHISDTELTGLVKTGATVCLCPSTEADLGDGLFPFDRYIAASGLWSIGSDSNTSVNPTEEIRLLDYQTRLKNRKRNAFHFDSALGSGTKLYQMACEGGRKASGLAVGRIEVESHADFVELNHSHDLTRGLSADEVLNAYVYSGGKELIEQVFVSGQKRL